MLQHLGLYQQRTVVIFVRLLPLQLFLKLKAFCISFEKGQRKLESVKIVIDCYSDRSIRSAVFFDGSQIKDARLLCYYITVFCSDKNAMVKQVTGTN